MKRITQTSIRIILLLALFGTVSCESLLDEMVDSLSSVQKQVAFIMRGKPATHISLVYDGREVPVGNLIDMRLTLEDTSKKISITMQNTGNVQVAVSAITLGGRYCDRFSITGGTGAVLEPKDDSSNLDETSFDVSFKSEFLNDGYKAAVVSIETEDSEGKKYAPFNVTVSCERIELARAMLQVWRGYTMVPSSSDYPMGTVTGTSSSIFTLKNAGTCDLTLKEDIGVSDPLNFSVTGPAAGTSIPVGGSVSMVLTFNPTLLGYHEAVLTLKYEDGIDPNCEFTLNLSGTATDIPLPEIDIQNSENTSIINNDPVPEQFGVLALNATSPLHTFRIRNLGTGDLDISSVVVSDTSDPGSFIYNGPTLATVKVGDYTSFTLSYCPKKLGEHSATITIISNDNNAKSFVLNLAGSTFLPSIQLSQESTVIPKDGTYSFGTWGADGIDRHTSGKKIFTITNTGDEILTISGITLEEAAEEHFHLDMKNTATYVPANGSTTFTMYFDPQNYDPDNKNANLTISSNAADAGIYPVTLTGTAKQPFMIITIYAYQIYTGYCSDSGSKLDLHWQNFTVCKIGECDVSDQFEIADGSHEMSGYSYWNIYDATKVKSYQIPKAEDEGIQLHIHFWEYDDIGDDEMCHFSFPVKYDFESNELRYSLSGEERTVVSGTNFSQAPWSIPFDGNQHSCYLFSWGIDAGEAVVEYKITAQDYLYP